MKDLREWLRERIADKFAENMDTYYEQFYAYYKQRRKTRLVDRHRDTVIHTAIRHANEALETSARKHIRRSGTDEQKEILTLIEIGERVTKTINNALAYNRRG